MSFYKVGLDSIINRRQVKSQKSHLECLESEKHEFCELRHVTHVIWSVNLPMID